MKFRYTLSDIVIKLLPVNNRGKNFVKLLNSSVKGLQTLNTKFANFVDVKRNFLQYNNEIIYLEKMLNDNYPNGINDLEIYIEDAANDHVFYIYQKTDLATKRYLYLKYNNATSYTAGDRVSYNNFVYVCIFATTGNLPIDHHYWRNEKIIQYLFKKSEIPALVKYIIWVPDVIKVSAGYPAYTRLKALVNQYNFSTITYEIKEYI